MFKIKRGRRNLVSEIFLCLREGLTNLTFVKTRRARHFARQNAVLLHWFLTLVFDLALITVPVMGSERTNHDAGGGKDGARREEN